MKSIVFFVIACCLLVSAVGCSGRTAESAISDVNKNNVQRLANLYVRFQTQNRWRGPKDEAEFKEYINGLAPLVLERMGIEPGKTDDLFMSARDNSPLKVRYGVRGNARGSNDAVVFESEGVDGARMVGFTSMSQEMVEDDARYDGLFSGKVKGEAVKVNNAAPRK